MTLLTQSQSDYCAEYDEWGKLFAANVQQFKPRTPVLRFGDSVISIWGLARVSAYGLMGWAGIACACVLIAALSQ